MPTFQHTRDSLPCRRWGLTSSPDLDKTGKACEVKQPPSTAEGMRVSNPVTPRRDANARTELAGPQAHNTGTMRRGKMVIRRVHTPGECWFESSRRDETPADRLTMSLGHTIFPSTRTVRMVATDHATGPHIKGGEQCMTSHTPKYHQAASKPPHATHATTMPSHSML